MVCDMHGTEKIAVQDIALTGETNAGRYIHCDVGSKLADNNDDVKQ